MIFSTNFSLPSVIFMSEPSSKRIKTPMNYVSSAGSWRNGEMEKDRFNYKFQLFKGDQQFHDFFGMKISLDSNFHKWLWLDWANKNNLRDMDKVQLKLIEQIRIFEMEHSQTAVDSCVRKILELLNFPNYSTKFKYGIGIGIGSSNVDFVFEDEENFYNCVIQNKCGGPYSMHGFKQSRNEIVACMISLASQNMETLEMDGKEIGDQIIYGILFMGLTPCFYKANISRSYLKCLQSNEKSEELIINEFRVDRKFTDREILCTSSRELIFSALLAMKERIVKSKS